MNDEHEATSDDLSESSGTSGSSVYEIEIGTLDGGADLLGELAGKVSLFVNVASKCGLTPQYEGLEELQKRFGDSDFSVVGFPCNQFLGQEPGSAEEIQEFCSTTYGVTFPLSEKIDVNGEDRHPLYSVLAGIADSDGHVGDIRWNFEKFLVTGDGRVTERFSPQVEPSDPQLVSAIESALGGVSGNAGGSPG